MNRDVYRISDLSQCCIQCNKESSFECRVCKTPYCGKMCQKKNWRQSHKYICHSPGDFQLSRILKGIIEKYNSLGKKFLGSDDSLVKKFLGSDDLNLSKAGHHYFFGSKLFDFKPFCIGGRRVSSDHVCPVCGDIIDYDGPFNDLECKFYYESKLQKIKYYRCVSCNNSKKEICSQSLMETQKCGSYPKKNLLCFLLCSEKWCIPQDIRQIVVTLLRDIKCCSCW